MSVLPVSNIINVSITNTPSGLTTKNVNSLALFTNDASASLDPFGIYISPAQVAEDYGTNSETTQMANAIFAQTPNLRTGDGRLVIIPMMSAVSATPGNFTSTNLSANLATMITVNNGDIKITVNSVAYNLLGMNFTACTTWADIAQVIQNRIVDATVEAIANGIKITSKKVGTSSTVALAAATGGTGTALNGSGYLNGAGGTSTAGANSSGETMGAAITRTIGQVSYAAVMSTLDQEDAKITATATQVQALDMLYFEHAASTQDIAGLATTIQQASETKTRILTFTQGIAQAKLYKAAYAGRALSVNFQGSLTSQTMNLKALATITPDLGISQTLYEAAKVAGTDLYVSYEGLPAVLSTGGNDFFDNPYSDLALKFALESAGFNYLRQTNTKVPQTEAGMSGLKSAYAQVMQQFVRNGCVAPGTWTSSETFGDPETFKQNVSNFGYYIYSLPITQQDPVEREQRKAPLVQIAVKRAGAIHTSDVIVVIND